MNRNLPYKLFLTGITLLLCQAATAQNLGFEQDDYIKISGVTTDGQIAPLTPAQKTTTILYYDGLGRPLQTVTEQASPLSHDMIQPAAYDNLGRQTTSYLPYADESANPTGSYRPNAISTDQPAFWDNTAQHLVARDGAAYQQQVFENSPLQRLLQAGMVGSGFQPVSGQKYKTVSYRPNNSTADGNILRWNPDGTYTTGAFYANNSLSVTDATDEDNVEVLVFTDLAKRTILKRQILSSGNLDTYYVYNNAGMVSYVVPPNALALMVASGNYNLGQTGAVSAVLFHYTYNAFGQPVTRTIPGKGTMSIVYDPLNRPVLLQDANLAANKNWNYIKYDVKGRPISQGIYNDMTHTSLAAMQSYVSGLSYTVWYESRTSTVTNSGYYTNSVFPTTGLTPLAYAYYDDYYMTQGGSPDFAYVTQSDPNFPNEETATTAAVKGMPTILCKTTVGTGLTNTWLTSATFYDKRLHPIQVRSNNHLYYTGFTTSASLTDTKTIAPDFTGVPLDTKVAKQNGASSTNTVYSYFSYDQVYRVTGISQKYNTGPVIVTAAYTYNEAGQVVAKNLGQVTTAPVANLTLNGTQSSGTATASNSITFSSASPNFNAPSGIAFTAFISSATGYLQTADYRYNIRGQLLSINNSKLTNDGGVTNNDNNDLFGMAFSYDQTNANIGNTPSYDGKLTAVQWMARDGVGYERSYKFAYDGINRYTGEIYAERTAASTGSFSNNVDGFDENGITYDAGGNIVTLTRNSSTEGTNSHIQIDNLAYSYNPANPNHLLTVTDGTGVNYTSAGFRNLTGSTGNYTYDGNGNLATDPYKGLSISYDVLNRTDKITVTTATNRYIYYVYDAGGNLIRKQAYDNNTLQTTTDYIDGFVYVNNVLSYFPMPEGRVVNNGGTLVQEFVITDQQGNARVSFQNNGSAPVIKQENSYYGFGLVLLNSPVSTPAIPNKQLYNGGSEWQNDFSNLPDYYQTFNRNYDAAIGRFVGVDPQAEGAESMTTYQYAGNNPIMMNDPMGNLAMRLPLPQFPPGYGLGVGGAANNVDDDGIDVGGGGAGFYSAFWSALIGDANSYLATNQTTTNALTGSQVSQLYDQFEKNGDNGLITNAFYNSDDANFENSGNQGGIFNLLYFPSGNSSAGNGARAFGQMVEGYNADQGNFNPNTFVGYNFIQLVSQDGGQSIIDNHEPSFLQSMDPFYYNSSDNTDLAAYVAQYARFGGTILFIDRPNTNGSIYTFSAQTTLVGILGSGQIQPIASFSWGYSVNSGNPSMTGSLPLLISTPNQTQNIIQGYNFNAQPGGAYHFP